MKVAHLYQQSNIRFNAPQAAQVHIYHTMRGLQQSGYEVSLIALQARRVLFSQDLAVFTHGDLPTDYYARQGISVIDEQHRFGVEQRGLLEAKAGDADPHVLLMTATPIPRTLGQVLYADLDVSDLRAAPSGRVPIRTAIRHPADQERLWDFVTEEGRAGRRASVVPLRRQSYANG